MSDEQIDDFVDQRLESGERVIMDAHLAECAQCTAALRDTRGLIQASRSLDRAEVPDSLWPMVASETLLMSRIRSRFLRRLRLPLALAACLLVLTTGLVVHEVDARRVDEQASSARAATILRGPPQDSAFYEQREREFRAGASDRGRLILAGIDSLSALDQAIALARSDSSASAYARLARLLEARHYYLRELLRALDAERGGLD